MEYSTFIALKSDAPQENKEVLKFLDSNGVRYTVFTRTDDIDKCVGKMVNIDQITCILEILDKKNLVRKYLKSMPFRRVETGE
jgi:hypothetical protein